MHIDFHWKCFRCIYLLLIWDYGFAVCTGEFRHAYGEEHEKTKKYSKAAEKVSNQHNADKPAWDLNASESSHAALEEWRHYLSTTVSDKMTVKHVTLSIKQFINS